MNMLMQNDRKTERGFASITVALVLVLVLALLTTGFSQLARREQRSTLDKQLASSANYAAESGINEAVKRVRANPAAYTGDGTTCDSSFNLSPSNMVSPTSSYSCVTVNVTPPRLIDSNITPGDGRSLEFKGDSAIGDLVFQWGSATNRKGFKPNVPSSGEFDTLGNWGSTSTPPVMQINITPVTSYNRASMNANQFTVYLYPASSGIASTVYNTAGDAQGLIVSGDCGNNTVATDALPCAATLNFTTPFSADTPYIVHAMPLYDSANFQVTGHGAGGGPLKFKDGQAIIDVTGKAKDVLKRLQVAVPITQDGSTSGSATGAIPDFAIQAGDFCKRQDTEPGSTYYVALNNTRTASTATGVSDGCNQSN